MFFCQSEIHFTYGSSILQKAASFEWWILATLVWQQDGAPCHVTKRNMRYLDSQFGARVLSRNSIQGRDWPARSPDLNPLDYFLWGYLKSKVYSPWPRNLDDLETNITREVRNLQPAMITRAIMEIKVRAQKCLNARGGPLRVLDCNICKM